MARRPATPVTGRVILISCSRMTPDRSFPSTPVVANAVTAGEFAVHLPNNRRRAPVLPISYTVDSDAGTIVETWTGDITAKDLASYWKGYLADPEVLAIRRTLVDLRASHITFTGEELSHLVDTIVVPVLNGRMWKTAILVSDPVQFGVSRQYHVFAERFSNDAIFRDQPSAVQWLERQ